MCSNPFPIPYEDFYKFIKSNSRAFKCLKMCIPDLDMRYGRLYNKFVRARPVFFERMKLGVKYMSFLISQCNQMTSMDLEFWLRSYPEITITAYEDITDLLEIYPTACPRSTTKTFLDALQATSRTLVQINSLFFNIPLDNPNDLHY